MKLYVRQKPLSWTEKFSVINSKEEDRYFVEGENLSLGRKLHIYDTDKNEVACVKQKFASMQPRYGVFQSGNKVIEVMQKFTVAKHKYAIFGSDWTISGDLGQHAYTISCSYGKVAVVSVVEIEDAAWIELDLSNTVNEANIVRALATVLAIDCVVAKKIKKQPKAKKQSDKKNKETE